MYLLNFILEYFTNCSLVSTQNNTIKKIFKSSRPEVLCKKKLLLEISQNSQEKTCARDSFLMKLQPAILLKKSVWHRCFPVNFAKFLRTPSL